VHFRVSDGQSARPRTYERLGIQSARFAGQRVATRPVFSGGGGRVAFAKCAKSPPTGAISSASCAAAGGIYHRPLKRSLADPFLPRRCRDVLEQLCGNSSDHEGDDKIAAREGDFRSQMIRRESSRVSSARGTRGLLSRSENVE